jgi:dipeptidyl aminopeptidase/acylaminoacyl peptidase
MTFPPARLACLAALITALLGQAQAPAKRPITHADYAGWRSIQAPALSPDGNLVAYALAPQEGDGEVVLLDLRTGKQHKAPRGQRATVAATGKRQPGPVGASQHLFTPDSRFLLFPIYPSKGDKAKMLTGTGLGILEAATGKAHTVPNVRGYQVAEEGKPFAAFLKSVRPAPPESGKEKEKPGEKGKKGPAQPSAATPLVGELVLRNLETGEERTFSDVTEFSLARDGKALAYVVQPQKKDAVGGVFVVTPGRESPPLILRSAAGKFSRLTWDEKQSQLAFFHAPPAVGKEKAPPPSIIHWKRTEASPALAPPAVGMGPMVPPIPAGVELVPKGKAEVKEGWQLSATAGLAFSQDGKRLYFGLTPPPAPKPAGDRPNVELWHYLDDFIQPMQRARFSQAQAKSYRGVFDLEERTCRQLADETMPDVTAAPEGGLALGYDDRPYRRLVGGSELTSYSDLYVLSQKTGERKLLLKKQAGLAWSPGGKYLLRFDGKDWHCHDPVKGGSVNLTAGLKASFADETFDMPSARPPFGVAGWLPGDEAVLLYDRYDLWRITPDRATRECVTQGVGAKGRTSLRLVQLDPRARTIDPARPLLLRAEGERSRDTGFYRLKLGSEPKLLILGARHYSNPIQKGSRFLFTVSTFRDYPDLYVSDLDFTEVKRVTDANPQLKEYRWGKAEMVRYRSSDGVPLQGVLLKPDGFDPEKKYPMIVYIYERLSQNLHRFSEPRPGTSINPSYYVSNGYLVLMPDIAYTVGYPGASALKCVLPAIDKVVDQGCVDENAIGIQGHSWGGYQVAYLVTQTTRFKAAAAGAPVTNMTSAYGGIRWGTGLPRQFQYEKAQSRIGGSLWQYPTRFVENSPLFAADRVKTPLLMLHNDQDEAVPWQEGIQYYLALRRLDREVYLFNYPGEKHGLTQRKNQLDYTVRMQQFFDHHLKGAAKPEWMARGEAYIPPQPPGLPQPSGSSEESEEP